MKIKGQPFSIQATDGRDWLVTWTPVDAADGHHISFTVAIRGQDDLSVREAQKRATARAAEMLQEIVAQMT